MQAHALAYALTDDGPDEKLAKAAEEESWIPQGL